MIKMFKKEVLLGNFIKKYKILSYLEYIHNEYGVPFNNLFVYEVEGNNFEYIVTFKIDTNKRHYVSEIKGGTILHFKRGCLFSINALNKLIDAIAPDVEDKKDYELNWEEYNNKIILINKDEVSVKNINKIEDKGVFFK